MRIKPKDLLNKYDVLVSLNILDDGRIIGRDKNDNRLSVGRIEGNIMYYHPPRPLKNNFEDDV